MWSLSHWTTREVRSLLTAHYHIHSSWDVVSPTFVESIDYLMKQFTTFFLTEKTGYRFCIYPFITGTMLLNRSVVSDSVNPWTAAPQTSLSFNISRSLLKLMSIESVMPSNNLILCRPLLLPSIFPSIRVFSNESVLHIRWPKYWSFSFNISPSTGTMILYCFLNVIIWVASHVSKLFVHNVIINT